MRWRSFCNELLGFAHELGVELVVILGALLGDTPHTRPVPVSGVTSDPDLARTMDLEETKYEGPTGIVGILQEACTHAGVPAVSLWAAVPHYVSQPPNPKATLALLNRLEDLIDLRIPLGELPEDARAWQLGVDQLAAEDSEVAEYVQTLEEARDTAELPEASGEAIAREFERYLRRRDGGGPAGPAPADMPRPTAATAPRICGTTPAVVRSLPSPAAGDRHRGRGLPGGLSGRIGPGGSRADGRAVRVWRTALRVQRPAVSTRQRATAITSYGVSGVGVVVNRALGRYRRSPYAATVVGTSRSGSVRRRRKTPLRPSGESRKTSIAFCMFCTTYSVRPVSSSPSPLTRAPRRRGRRAG